MSKIMLKGIDYSAPSANNHDYGICSTTASDAAKTVACTGFALIPGAEITVKFTVTNTATNPTLNVNSSGAKPIYYRNAAISADILAENHTYSFRYNGNQWELVGDINTNTTYANMTAATASAAGKAGLVPIPAAGTQNNYLTGAGTWQSVDDHAVSFTSTDTNDANASQWTSVAKLVSGETHKSIFNKLSTMFKNLRYLYKLLGTTNISAIGGGTVTGAISFMNTALAGKAAASHSHDYIPTTASCNKNWIWSGQGGQPTWIWGGEDGTNMYVYSPNNFSVNYAASAGSIAYENVSGRPTFSISGTTLNINF